MMQNSNKSRYMNAKNESLSRRPGISYGSNNTSQQSRNYLKPTYASMNRTRSALSDVTQRVVNKPRSLDEGIKTNNLHKRNVSKPTRTQRFYSNADNNTGSRVRLYEKEIENSNKRKHGTSSRNISIYSDEVKSESNEDLRDEIMTDDSSILDNDGTSNAEIEPEPVEPLLPIYDDKSNAILDEALMKYFSPIPDPNDPDLLDPVMVSEYSIDIFSYMKELEVRYAPRANYIELQPQLTWDYRSQLIDWLIKVHEKFQLLPETLYLAVNIMDRFLSKKVATLNRFQLVAITALMIACKYEEIFCPTLKDLLYIVDNEYTTEDIIQAEKFMINTLNFELSWPGPMSFLRRISKADSYEYSIRTLSKYFLETTLLDPRLVASPPSWLAAGAYFLSRFILKGSAEWSLKHCYYSGYTQEQLFPLLILISENCKDGETKHNAIWNKYSGIKYHQSREVFENWIENLPK